MCQDVEVSAYEYRLAEYLVRKNPQISQLGLALMLIDYCYSPGRAIDRAFLKELKKVTKIANILP